MRRRAGVLDKGCAGKPGQRPMCPRGAASVDDFRSVDDFIPNL